MGQTTSQHSSQEYTHKVSPTRLANLKAKARRFRFCTLGDAGHQRRGSRADTHDGMQEALGHRDIQVAPFVNVSKYSLPPGSLESERRLLVQRERRQQKPPGTLTPRVLKPDD